MSKKVKSKEDLMNVASVSANNDREIGKLISEAMEQVGKDGVVTVEEAKTSANRTRHRRRNAV